MSNEEQLKRALTPPAPGLRTVGPGLFVSTRSVKEILEQAAKHDPAQHAETPRAPTGR
jgi:hypothetical protein